VTYVVREGESQRILSWYGTACGMERFLCTATESKEEGTVIADDVGLRLAFLLFVSLRDVNAAKYRY
jgi:hypothetical protein